MRDVALDVELGPLAIRRRRQRDVVEDPGARPRRDPADDAALAGGVATLEDDDGARAGGDRPRLQPRQLDLKRVKFSLKILARQPGRLRRRLVRRRVLVFVVLLLVLLSVLVLALLLRHFAAAFFGYRQRRQCGEETTAGQEEVAALEARAAPPETSCGRSVRRAPGQRPEASLRQRHESGLVPNILQTQRCNTSPR